MKFSNAGDSRVPYDVITCGILIVSFLIFAFILTFTLLILMVQAGRQTVVFKISSGTNNVIPAYN